jgi:hypothetical protein
MSRDPDRVARVSYEVDAAAPEEAGPRNSECTCSQPGSVQSVREISSAGANRQKDAARRRSRLVSGAERRTDELNNESVGRWDLCLGWAAAKVDEAVVLAQTPSPVMMQRIYTGTDGLSHVEQVELNAQSVLEQVTGAVVRVSQPGSFSDWHVGPTRRYIINLTGGGQLEVAEGKVDLPPGTIEFIDDLTGKGHTTAHVGQEPRVSIHFEFVDQQQIIGPIGQQ